MTPINEGKEQKFDITVLVYRCEICRYYYKVDDKQGECRARPPQVVLLPVQTLKGNGLSPVGLFPPVLKTSSCGCFQLSKAHMNKEVDRVPVLQTGLKSCGCPQSVVNYSALGETITWCSKCNATIKSS
jgi:hypothetical protein